MKKVQKASNHDKALDELYKRYEERGANYNESPEYTEQKTREIKMRETTRRAHMTNREYIPGSNVELDTVVILQDIDRIRYTKKDSMNKNDKKDIKAQLQKQADKTNPKPDKKQVLSKNENLPQNKQGKTVSIKEVAKEAAKTWIPLNERNEEKIEQGGKTKIPGTLILAIIVITISLLMIVGSAVLLGSAKSEQNELKDQIEMLDFQISELRTDLDRKNADADIEIFAKEELGMISQEHVNFEYINSNKTDELQKEETQKVSFGSLIRWIFQQLK